MISTAPFEIGFETMEYTVNEADPMVNVCVVFIKPGEFEDVDLGDLFIESEISSVSLNLSSAGKIIMLGDVCIRDMIFIAHV